MTWFKQRTEEQTSRPFNISGTGTPTLSLTFHDKAAANLFAGRMASAFEGTSKTVDRQTGGKFKFIFADLSNDFESFEVTLYDGSAQGDVTVSFSVIENTVDVTGSVGTWVTPPVTDLTNLDYSSGTFITGEVVNPLGGQLSANSFFWYSDGYNGR